VNSALYVGRVTHRRKVPFEHAFSLPLFMTWLDLAELGHVFEGRWLWSTRRRAFARFDRRDYLGDPDVPLDEAVRRLVEERLGRRPRGPIRLLTHLRTAGLRMNPISLYYCYAESEDESEDESEGELDAVVAEVTNTPWDERHCYVLDVAQPQARHMGDLRRVRQPKAFHVSPFMPMDQGYTFVLDRPGRRLGLRIENRDATGKPVFDAGLQLERRELTGWNMAWALVRYPFVTVQVAFGIYLQALILWLRGARFHSHPGQAGQSPPSQAERPLRRRPAADRERAGAPDEPEGGARACRQVRSSPRPSSITS
jgi:DUF1365 family protein